jgi:hypothetical protein
VSVEQPVSALNPFPFTAEGLFSVSALVSAVLLALGFAAADSLDSTGFCARGHHRTGLTSARLTQVGIGKLLRLRVEGIENKGELQTQK